MLLWRCSFTFTCVPERIMEGKCVWLCSTHILLPPSHREAMWQRNVVLNGCQSPHFDSSSCKRLKQCFSPVSKIKFISFFFFFLILHFTPTLMIINIPKRTRCFTFVWSSNAICSINPSIKPGNVIACTCLPRIAWIGQGISLIHVLMPRLRMSH